MSAKAPRRRAVLKTWWNFTIVETGRGFTLRTENDKFYVEIEFDTYDMDTILSELRKVVREKRRKVKWLEGTFEEKP